MRLRALSPRGFSLLEPRASSRTPTSAAPSTEYAVTLVDGSRCTREGIVEYIPPGCTSLHTHPGIYTRYPSLHTHPGIYTRVYLTLGLTWDIHHLGYTRVYMSPKSVKHRFPDPF